MMRGQDECVWVRIIEWGLGWREWAEADTWGGEQDAFGGGHGVRGLLDGGENEGLVSEGGTID